MSDVVLGALIGGSFTLVGVLVEKLFLLRSENSRAKKEFFKDAFSERREAHRKIAGVITENSLMGLSPKFDSRLSVKAVLVEVQKKVLSVALDTRFIADEQVSITLITLYERVSETIENMELVREEKFGESLKMLVRKNGELVKLLREKSGVDIIDEEFAKTLKGSQKHIKKKKEGSCQNIGSQKAST